MRQGNTEPGLRHLVPVTLTAAARLLGILMTANGGGMLVGTFLSGLSHVGSG
jgi:hypothetical protein